MEKKTILKRPDEPTAQDLPGKTQRPRNPYVVLAVAMVLPGGGQVMNNTPLRGLVMIFFMIVGAWICFHTTTPDHSFLGRYAGGWFVYAMSVLDAYKWARYRFEYQGLDTVDGASSP